MKQTALYTAAAIFTLVSLAHWIRFFTSAEVTIGSTVISLELSVVAGLVTAALAIWMVMAARGP